MPRPRGHPDAALIARLASVERWAREPDRTAATAPARQAAKDKFLTQARERFGDLPPDELAYRAGLLAKAHFTRMALRSAQSRRRNRAARETGDAS
ncbi:MAG: hypothetical protein ACRDWI_07815 [Jiangellaceae bacterium]